MSVTAGELRVGTSSWSAESWVGTFYPQGTAPHEYLAHYASRFDTVEVDATLYRTPTERMVDGWRDKTPPGFLFAAKVPQIITHEKLLESCADDLGAFLKVMKRLGEILRKGKVLTTDFAYIRWLGDRKGIEERTQRCDRLILDRRRDMGRWIPSIRRLIADGTAVYGYFNNHYAGHAIGSIELFQEMWGASA